MSATGRYTYWMFVIDNCEDLKWDPEIIKRIAYQEWSTAGLKGLVRFRYSVNRRYVLKHLNIVSGDVKAIPIGKEERRKPVGIKELFDYIIEYGGCSKP